MHKLTLMFLAAVCLFSFGLKAMDAEQSLPALKKLAAQACIKQKAPLELLNPDLQEYITDEFLLKDPRVLAHCWRKKFELQGPIWQVWLSNNGDRLLVARPYNSPMPFEGNKFSFTLHNGIDGTIIKEIALNINEILKVQFNAQGTRFYIHSSDGVTLWESKKGSLIKKLAGQGTRCAEFSPLGNQVITCGRSSKAVMIWDAIDGNLDGELIGHGGGLSSAEFNLSGDVYKRQVFLLTQYFCYVSLHLRTSS